MTGATTAVRALPELPDIPWLPPLAWIVEDERVLWFLMRGSGIVALGLLTLSVALGVAAAVARAGGRRPGLPRFALQALHRDVSLMSLLLVVVHVVTAVVHDYVDIRWVDAVVPFVGPYQPLWIGLGALALDLLLVAAVAAAARDRLGARRWTAVHGLAYVAWPVAAAHTIGIGTDMTRTWGLAVLAALLAVFVVTVLRRVAARRAAEGETALPGGVR